MVSPHQIAPGVYRVDALPIPNAISVLLLRGDNGWTLVDTGIGLSAGRIRSALASLGAGSHDLIRIVLTHHHSDHVGGLPRLLTRAPAAEVWTSEREAPIMIGSRPPDGPANAVMGRVLATMKVPTVPIARTLQEGDLVAGFRVIDTPGHTLGHISLLRDDGLLFTADALGNLLPGVRVGVAKSLCSDPAQAQTSAEKLAGEDVRTVVFSHGPVLRTDAGARLRAAVARGQS